MPEDRQNLKKRSLLVDKLAGNAKRPKAGSRGVAIYGNEIGRLETLDEHGSVGLVAMVDGGGAMLPVSDESLFRVFEEDAARANTALGGVANGWNDTNSKWQVVGNQLRGDTAGYTADFLARPTSETLADVSVSAIAEYADNGAGQGNTALLWVRADASTRNGYVAWLGYSVGTGPVLTLGKMAAGTPSFTSVAVPSLTIGQYYRLTLRSVGSRITAVVEAATALGTIIGRHSLTDTSYTSGVVMLSPLSAGGRVSLVAIHDFRRAPRLVCDGNSMTSVYMVSAGEDYPSQLGAIVGSGWVVHNLGVPAQTTATMLTDAVSQVDALYDAKRRSVVIAWEVTNHLFFGASTATAIAAFKNYCAGRKAAGFSVIAVTVLPRSEVGTPANQEANRLAANIELRRPENIGVFWDAVCDVAAHPDLQDTTNTTYYQDRTHLTPVGYSIIARMLASTKLGQITA